MFTTVVSTHKFIRVKDINLAYTDQGDASLPVIVFIHGLTESIGSWASNIDELKENFRCIALDLPGHGLSEGGDHPYTPSFYEEIVVGFIKKLGFDQITVAGHSLGGQVAILLAVTNPKLVKRLILISPAGFEAFTEKDEHWIIEQAKSYSAHAESFDFLKMLPYYKRPSRQVYLSSITGMLNQPVLEYLTKITQPALVIFGKEDPLIPNRFLHPLLSLNKVAEDGARKIPKAKLVIIKNAGHFVNMEKFSEVNSEIKAFIRG
jgi:pimeloyl-ACP methyl ester carboxylesterase